MDKFLGGPGHLIEAFRQFPGRGLDLGSSSASSAEKTVYPQITQITQSYFFRFTNCFTSSFPIGLDAEMMMAAVPSANGGTVQRTMVVPSAAVLPRKITRGGSTVEMTFISIAAAAIGFCDRLFFAATRSSTAMPA